MEVESKAINRILSSILHDTKKPFNNLKMFLDLLESKGNDLEFLKKSSQSLLKDADELFNFIRRLKEYFGPFKSYPETVIFKEIILRSFEDLNLSLCSKILQEFGCLLSFCKRQDGFELLVEIPLITQ